MRETIWTCPDLPFHISAMATPDNPPGVPNILPFTLEFVPRTGLLVQRQDPHVLALLNAAYEKGSIIGVAMDDTALGRSYADDFLGFMATVRPGQGWTGLRALEIGAGRGFLTSLLANAGCDVIGLEPGRENAPHWQRHKARVIADSFPSARVSGRFDLIIAFGVLEHVPDISVFLDSIRRQTTRDGLVVFAVPDCRAYIEAGDPSMLVHEHWSYFTAETLRRTLEDHGYTVLALAPSGYGGALYVAATPGDGVPQTERRSRGEDSNTASARAFADRVCALRQRMAAWAGQKDRTLGVFCPGRGLAVLPVSAPLRFFDDNPDIQGKYYPPFASIVESRQSLLNAPTDELFILSRTFGERLAAELRGYPELGTTRILTLNKSRYFTRAILRIVILCVDVAGNIREPAAPRFDDRTKRPPGKPWVSCVVSCGAAWGPVALSVEAA